MIVRGKSVPSLHHRRGPREPVDLKYLAAIRVRHYFDHLAPVSGFFGYLEKELLGARKDLSATRVAYEKGVGALQPLVDVPALFILHHGSHEGLDGIAELNPAVEQHPQRVSHAPIRGVYLRYAALPKEFRQREYSVRP